MKRKGRYLLVVMTLLLFFAFFHPVHCEENVKPKETIRMAMFINYHPAYGSWVSRIVVFDFEGVEGLPIDTSNPAFGNGFREATIVWVSYGMEGFAIRVALRYDLSVDNDTANEYVSIVSDEVMETLNQAGLPIYWRGSHIDNKTNTRIVAIDRGLLPRTYGSLQGLLRYRPSDGFAGLITEKLLRKIIPGEIRKEGPLLEIGLSKLKYTLQKTNDDFSWRFEISFGMRTELKNEEWVETLDLNSLLLNDGPIQPSIQRISEIIVEMPRKHSIPFGTYEMNMESISPPGSVEEGEWIQAIYQVSTPINNVVATIRVNKLKPGFEWNRVLVIALGIAALVAIVALLIKKHKGRNFNESYNVNC